MHTPHSQWDTEGQPDSQSFLTSHSSYFFLSFKWVKNLSRKFSGAGCFKGFKGGKGADFEYFWACFKEGTLACE